MIFFLGLENGAFFEVFPYDIDSNYIMEKPHAARFVPGKGHKSPIK